MDIFNRKKVQELESALSQYKHELANAEHEIKQLLEMKNSIPDRCDPGEYCKICEFGKVWEYRSHIYGYHNSNFIGYICNKGNVCPCFMQKKQD